MCHNLIAHHLGSLSLTIRLKVGSLFANYISDNLRHVLKCQAALLEVSGLAVLPSAHQVDLCRLGAPELLLCINGDGSGPQFSPCRIGISKYPSLQNAALPLLSTRRPDDFYLAKDLILRRSPKIPVHLVVAEDSYFSNLSTLWFCTSVDPFGPRRLGSLGPPGTVVGLVHAGLSLLRPIVHLRSLMPVHNWYSRDERRSVPRSAYSRFRHQAWEPVNPKRTDDILGSSDRGRSIFPLANDVYWLLQRIIHSLH